MEGKFNKLILITTSLGAFVGPFMSSAANIALPTIGTEFSMNSIWLNWVTLAFTLATAIFILPFGRLADIFGRKKLFVIGMAVFAIASIVCGASVSPVMLISARAVQGLSYAAVSVTVVSILTSVFPAGARGKALGLNVAMTYIGLSVGPFLGGVLTKYLGWRSMFFIIAAVSIFVVLSLISLKQEWMEAEGEKFDFAGSVIYGVALLGIIAGFSVIHSISGPVLLIIGLVAIVAFGLFENKVKQPILTMSLFKNNRVLTFSSIAALINYSATYALSFLLSMYLQYIKGYDPSMAGLILIAQPVMMAIFSPIAGFVSDRIEPQKVSSIGMALTTIGLAFFMFLDKDTSLHYIITALLILGFGFALFSSPNTNAVMSSVEKRYYGVTSGILGAARTVGQALSMGIASMVLAMHIGDEQINAGNALELIAAVKTTFIILTILCFIGIFASLARGKMHK